MADVTWGVKVPEELKEQINRLMQESGLQGKDFMQQVISTYVLEMAKEKTPEIAQDLNELQSLTQRINDIYLNMGHRIENLYEGKRQEVSKLLNKKDEIIREMHDELKDNKDKYENLVELYNEKNNNINDLNKSLERLTESNESLKSLNKEYEKNIMALDKKLQKYDEMIEEKEELEAQNALVIDEKKELILKIRERDTAIDELKSRIQHIKTKYEGDMKNLKQSFDIEKSRLTVQLERESIAKIEEVKREYEAAIERQKLREEQIKKNYEERISQLMSLYKELSVQVLKVEGRGNSENDD